MERFSVLHCRVLTLETQSINMQCLYTESFTISRLDTIFNQFTISISLVGETALHVTGLIVVNIKDYITTGAST